MSFGPEPPTPPTAPFTPLSEFYGPQARADIADRVDAYLINGEEIPELIAFLEAWLAAAKAL